jgi:hypothetical protein
VAPVDWEIVTPNYFGPEQAIYSASILSTANLEIASPVF